MIDKKKLKLYISKAKVNAAVAEQADARDLKSLGVTAVPVQIRPAAPKNTIAFLRWYFLMS